MDQGRQSPGNGCNGFFVWIAALVFFCSGISGLVENYRYSSNSVRTTAVVSYTWIQASRKQTIPLCYYDYTVDGRQYKGKAGGHYVGETIDIDYLKSDPSTSRVATSDSSARPKEIAFSFAGIGLAIVLTIIGCFMWKKTDDLTQD